MKFCTFYNRSPVKHTTRIDHETLFVDQSEAERASLKFQLERFGMDTLLSKLKQTQQQFGYADTRFSKSFSTLAQQYADATQYFSALPSEIRAEYNHDPIKFYEDIETNPKKAFDRGFISKDLAKIFGVYKEDISTTPVVNPTPVVETTVNTNVEVESA